jgi:hypothetical protein
MWKIQHLGLTYYNTPTYGVISPDSSPATHLPAFNSSCRRNKGESRPSHHYIVDDSASFFFFNTHSRYSSTTMLISSSTTLYGENLSSSS